MPQRFSYPVVEKLHLLGGVEPMLTAIEYGKRGIVGIGEAADSFGRLQIIRAAAQNCRRNIPLDGVFTDIAKIIPRQILAKPVLIILSALSRSSVTFAHVIMSAMSRSMFTMGEMKNALSVYPSTPEFMQKYAPMLLAIKTIWEYCAFSLAKNAGNSFAASHGVFDL